MVSTLEPMSAVFSLLYQAPDFALKSPRRTTKNDYSNILHLKLIADSLQKFQKYSDFVFEPDIANLIYIACISKVFYTYCAVQIVSCYFQVVIRPSR